jgi:NAD(P)-dependent dehydrogenase (short-subunit alcohol dehydrogenase family)
MSLIIEDKFVLISGATSDIGFAIAKDLAINCNLILHGRDIEMLTKLASEITNKKRILLWEYDLNNVENLSADFTLFLEDNLIAVESFIHVAATIKILPIKSFKLEYSNKIFNVNFFSAVEIIRSLLLKSNRENFNNIILISAYFSKFGNKGNSIYAATKGALDSLVKSLAVELAPKVRVNSILPGAIRTKMTNHLFEDETHMSGFRSKYLLGEGSAKDISNMVLFLLSNNASWITGQNVFVDGGASSH